MFCVSHNFKFKNFGYIVVFVSRPVNFTVKVTFTKVRKSFGVMSRSVGDTLDGTHLNELKVPYHDRSNVFTEKDLVAKEPIAQFKSWFELACQKGIREPNAMCLATATKQGLPSARFVLLKGYGKDGFRFFTNYNSRKGLELAENPVAALVFYWEPLKRSVRVEGVVEKLPAADSDEYFASRWWDSQIGTSVSAQSSVIPSRDTLSTLEEKMKVEFEGKEIPRPEFWGGYIVIPHSVEFWQGQTDRIHDRIKFRRPKSDEKPDGVMLHEGEDGWVYERLSP